MNNALLIPKFKNPAQRVNYLKKLAAISRIIGRIAIESENDLLAIRLFFSNLSKRQIISILNSGKIGNKEITPINSTMTERGEYITLFLGYEYFVIANINNGYGDILELPRFNRRKKE